MKDDRLITRTRRFTDLMNEKCDATLSIRPLTWKRLHSLSNVLDGPLELRQVTCRAELAFCATVRVKVLDRLEGQPYDLLEGNLHDNLHALSLDDDVPANPLLYKVWGLTRLGAENRAQAGVQLFEHTGCSNLIAEEGHVGISLQRKSHKGYHLKSLLMRGFLFSMRGFLPTNYEKEKAWLKLSADRLLKKRPERVSAYNMHIAASSASASRARFHASSSLFWNNRL